MGITLNHNVENVISDVEDVKDDLHDDTRKYLRGAMKAVLQTAISHINTDADWQGNLANSIRTHGVNVQQTSEGFEMSVGTDSGIAPYAPFIEYGTGKKAERSGPTSVPFPSFSTGDSVPVGYPFDSPSAVSEGLVEEITEWVKTKPIIPKKADSPEELGVMIAHEIVANGTYAHPFLRPAYYKNELQIKEAAKKAVRSATS